MTVNVADNTTSMNAAVESLKRDAAPKIIFGAGVIGEVLFQACSAAGVKVDCFCDDKVKGPVCGRKVLHSSELRGNYQDAIFFIASANIKDMVDRLKDLGYSKWHSCGLLLRDFKASQESVGSSAFTPEHVEYKVSTCVLCHDNYMNPDRLFVQSVDIIITEKCSMKCTDCSNLMQYYEKPENVELDETLKTIEAFCRNMDDIYEFRIIGGEPFMNKELHLVVEKLILEPKVKKIAIFTNGTILPRETQIPSLQNSKVTLFITDYDELSRKLAELTQLLDERGIAYFSQKAQGWTDCASLEKHNRTLEQGVEVFKECCAKNLATLSEGRLYRCPFHANGARLKAIPDVEEDFIDFLEKPLNEIDSTEMRKRLRSFLVEKTYIEACDYCNGRPYGAPKIIPAIQIDKPLPYKKVMN
ncbi:MAG: radical SAM protein [Nitrospira sp.]|nr:radical SAM protein [Nitrospira sp.]